MAKSTSKEHRYVALLRGINVGGNKKVPMGDLKKAFEDAGFTDIVTILNTGNVVFSAAKKAVEKDVQTLLEENFSFTIPFIIVPFETIEKLIAADPFKKVTVTKETRLYITFLPGKPTSKLKLPYKSEDDSFRIMTLIDEALVSVLDLSKTGTVDVMNIIEKEYGKNVTTRNWNTVLKIGNA